MTDRLKASSAAVIVFACVAVAGQQADRATTEALSRRAAERLQTLQAEADRLASEERTLIGDLTRLEIDRQIRAEGLRQTELKAEAGSAELRAIDEQVSRLETEKRSAGPDVAARIVELYKLGQGRYLKLLLSMSDVGRIGDASRMVAALAAHDRDRLSAYQQRLEELKGSRATLEARQRELTTLRAEAEQARAAAERAVSARNELIRRIDSERDLNAQLTGELQAAQQKLQATLRELAGGSRAEGVALPLKPFRGDLDWPVPGSVRTRFGSSGRTPGVLANGIDLAAPEGALVTAIHDGVVAFAGAFTGFGNLVILDHGAQCFSLYGDLLQTRVVRGQKIAAGREIGTVGVSPSGSAGLYFELRIDGRPVDPLQWMKKK